MEQLDRDPLPAKLETCTQHRNAQARPEHSTEVNPTSGFMASVAFTACTASAAVVLNTNIRASLNGRSEPSQIDLDEVCGRSDDATRIRADALWRITPAHHLRFMFFGNKTDRSRTVERDDFDCRLSTAYSGLQAYPSVAF